MKPLHIPLKAVLYKESGRWIAHCLEFDLVGDGDTQTEAIDDLSEAIKVQLESSIEFANPDNLFTPADGRYFRMFAAGKKMGNNVVEGMLSFLPKPNNVTIEEFETREYSDSDSPELETDCVYA